MINTNSWYIKSTQGVIGPFPAGQISQMVLLGRLNPNDKVSHDKEKWVNIGSVDSLIPDVYKTADSDDLSKERIEAAKRWADERREERRQDKRDDEENTQGRRLNETEQQREYREKRELTHKNISQAKSIPFIQISVFVIVIITGVYFSFLYSPDKSVESADCGAIPKPAINWKNCNKTGLVALKQDFRNSNFVSTNLSGANLTGSDLSNVIANYADFSRVNLSYANMTAAKLKGASFQGADLSQANMNNADLQYANLQNCNITGASFSNANLSFAIWVDGRTCKVDSISECK